MDKPEAKMLEKAKNQEEQELTKQEELKNKTKVKLPPLPKVLEKTKNQEEQDSNRQDFNVVKIFQADSFTNFVILCQLCQKQGRWCQDRVQVNCQAQG